jgi:hypothetical protein
MRQVGPSLRFLEEVLPPYVMARWLVMGLSFGYHRRPMSAHVDSPHLCIGERRERNPRRWKLSIK